ncbi:MAG TPA: GNAT family N-acetyltransferase [Actinomycetes bacterium]|nr:GNAT family N-acetyltransferase [Actinomycetes bacterium]
MTILSTHPPGAGSPDGDELPGALDPAGGELPATATPAPDGGAPWPGEQGPGRGEDRLLRVGATTLRVRRTAWFDGAALTAVLGRMSLRTRWLRFHSPIVRFSAAQLRALLEADHHDRSVLLAEVEVDPGRWQPVGFAQYARTGPDHADAAIVLEDAWQRRGIGRALALQLVSVARAAGIVAFTSEVLTENRRILAFVRALAPRVEGRLLGVTTELTCWLDAG